MVFGFGSGSRLKRVGDDSQLPEVKKPSPRAMLQGTNAFLPPPRSGSARFSQPRKRIRGTRSFKEHVMCRVFSEDFDAGESGVLDPRGVTIRRWCWVFFTASLLSLFVDPVFFYIPQVNDSDQVCMEEDNTAKVVLTVTRSLLDIFYFVQIFVRFHTAYISPSSRVFGRGELVIDSKKIALRYLSGEFWIDLFAALPLPQLLSWLIIPNVSGSASTNLKNYFWFLLFFQYIPRFILIFPLRSQIVEASGGLADTAWTAAAYNMLLFVLGSHVSGACFYLLLIGRETACWRSVCLLEQPQCNFSYLDCRTLSDPGRTTWSASTNVTDNCTPTNSFYRWGIFGTPAVTALVPSSPFLTKFFFCYWWGMNNLSCFGQNIAQITDTNVGEVIFETIVGILGLVLFALLIGNMARYVQSTFLRQEQWWLLRTDTEQWMHHRHLPPDLRDSVRMYEQCKWTATRGVDEVDILENLPDDLRRSIKRHLSLDLIRRVPLFNRMDDGMLDAICERLKPVLCTENMFLLREGDPVREVLFIVRGKLESWTTNGGRVGFFDSCSVGMGDFCGEELLTWALDPRMGIVLPLSTRTVKAIEEVDAFALEAEDLRFVASQFRRMHSKELRQKFRFYSHQWRTWAACFIQSAWRRSKKLKDENASRWAADNHLVSPGLRQSVSFWDAYATQLIESTRRNDKNKTEFTEEMTSSPQKPVDLDFSAD
ncbi:hypothetical protein MLD38_025257 [Melastoma candidum]|uniref:Uncharacterized protein n=1 Tax=Melastoma candidum TaxID=119954 RepID=A0ACB9NV94_9MYRT|nr:hypothetical protein MLD38_025257 [Melastoma candidum]